MYVDADGEYPPSQIPDLLKPIEDGEADYVLGSRYLGARGIRRRQSALRLMGNIVFTGLLSVAAGRRITDGQTGFRAFSRRALECAEIIHDLQLCPGSHPGPAEEGNAYAGSANLVPPAHKWQLFHKRQVSLAGAYRNAARDAEPVTPRHNRGGQASV